MNHTPESIKDLLSKNDRAVERAILAIYGRQTLDEQAMGDTRHYNGIGFSGAHANLGSYLARWLLKGNHLTGKHLDKARHMSMHYSRQLAEIANRNNE